MPKKKSEDGGYKVRLADGNEILFATATHVEELPNGTIKVKNDLITIQIFEKQEFSSYWLALKA